MKEDKSLVSFGFCGCVEGREQSVSIVMMEDKALFEFWLLWMRRAVYGFRWTLMKQRYTHLKTR